MYVCMHVCMYKCKKVRTSFGSGFVPLTTSSKFMVSSERLMNAYFPLYIQTYIHTYMVHTCIYSIHTHISMVIIHQHRNLSIHADSLLHVCVYVWMYVCICMNVLYVCVCMYLCSWVWLWWLDLVWWHAPRRLHGIPLRTRIRTRPVAQCVRESPETDL